MRCWRTGEVAAWVPLRLRKCELDFPSPYPSRRSMVARAKALASLSFAPHLRFPPACGWVPTGHPVSSGARSPLGEGTFLIRPWGAWRKAWALGENRFARASGAWRGDLVFARRRPYGVGVRVKSLLGFRCGGVIENLTSPAPAPLGAGWSRGPRRWPSLSFAPRRPFPTACGRVPYLAHGQFRCPLPPGGGDMFN